MGSNISVDENNAMQMKDMHAHKNGRFGPLLCSRKHTISEETFVQSGS